MGSEMCIRDRFQSLGWVERLSDGQVPLELVVCVGFQSLGWVERCLLYTSDAADERSSVDLGGRRIIKKKNSGARGRRGTRHIIQNNEQNNMESDTTKMNTDPQRDTNTNRIVVL